MILVFFYHSIEHFGYKVLFRRILDSVATSEFGSAVVAQDQPLALPSKSRALEWEDWIWDNLLASIGNREVIPILGPALSTVEHEGQEVSLTRFLAVRIASQLRLPVTDELGLGDIIGLYIDQRRSMAELYSRIYGILTNTPVKPSRALSQIASITHFNLYVTTSFDLLLEEALNRERFNGDDKTRSMAFVPKRAIGRDSSDIGPKHHLLAEPTVYHLFGKVSVLREYVVSDEDLLDYIEALFGVRKPKYLFDALGQNNLLLLGASFSDWLVRLFLRLVKTKTKLGAGSRGAALEILADEDARGDPSLVTFLSNFSKSTHVFPGNAPQFIDELTERWTARFGGAVHRSSRTIFLSYARQDEQSARALATALGSRGFDVWFDHDRMRGRGGTDYDEMIRRRIKTCALFMALLSKAADSDTRDAYFRREWHFAEERDTRNAANVQYIVPVVVDQSSRNDFATVPERFMKKNVHKAPAGQLTEELVDTLKAALGNG